MQILVTGANGLLGHHVVMQLLNKGHQVKIIVRSAKKIAFDLNRVECIRGNFNDKNTLYHAMQSCDAVIHIAAVTDMHLIGYQKYKNINVDATKKLLETVEELLINKVIFVSSANTIGFGSVDNLADENVSFSYPFTKSHYAKSKFEAEKLVVDFANASKNRHAIIINPTFMIGSHDTKPSSGVLVQMGHKKRFLFIPSGGKNFVAVEDVATACCNALTMGKSGERYLACNINLSFKEYFKIQSRVGNYQQIIMVLPDFLLKLVGYLGDFLQLMKIKVSFSSRNINQLLIKEYYTNAKAKKELSLPETPIEEAIESALKWFYPKFYNKKRCIDELENHTSA